MGRFLLLVFTVGYSLHYVLGRYDHALDRAIWSQKCALGEMALNDCNWCQCHGGVFMCDVRVCEVVDKFGHFNDAIRDIDVGMEGHGAWRSSDTPCEPGVHYTRGDLLCICSEEGNWPNPTCRDTFRVLYSVEVSQLTKKDNYQCLPTKLYLIGCNVCFCPSSGKINLSLCTKKQCDNDDPVLETNVLKSDDDDSKEISVGDHEEIYAQCSPGTNYKLGCKSCVCLKQNRLVCGSCEGDSEKAVNEESVDIIPVKTKFSGSCNFGISYKIDCNYCFCLKNGNVLCSTRVCN